MLTIELIFWASLLLLLYPHLIYPPVIARLARYFPYRGEAALAGEPEQWPEITLIISAFNEEAVIDAKLRNALQLDYPAERLTILVISDASDDRTDEIVNEWSSREPRIQLLRQAQRRGKTMGLNAGVAQARSELIVFSDANAMYRPDALKELARPFRRAQVGYVVGAALYNAQDDSGANQSEDLYWNMELSLKQWESDYYSVVGGDGAIYAIRRELYWELAEEDINDFLNPLQIVARGHIGLFNPRAICHEDTAEAFDKEFRRKRRIVNRSWRAFRKILPEFSPRRHGRFLFMLFSHKVIRWLAAPFLLLALAAAGLLALDGGLFYAVAFAGLLATLLVALAGHLLDRRGRRLPKSIYLPYYFYLVNLAALLGILDNFRGVRHVTWDHVRGGK